MREEKGFNGYGFYLAFNWYEATDGCYWERHPDYSETFNAHLVLNKEVLEKKPKVKQEDNVFYLYG